MIAMGYHSGWVIFPLLQIWLGCHKHKCLIYQSLITRSLDSEREGQLFVQVTFDPCERDELTVFTRYCSQNSINSPFS